MVELAVDIVAFCIVAAAVIAAVAILGAICSPFGEWLDAAPGRRRRFRWAFWSLLTLAIGALWWASSRASFVVAVALAGIVGIAAGILRIKDRWPLVGVVLVWAAWWGVLLGLIAAVLVGEGHLR